MDQMGEGGQDQFISRTFIECHAFTGQRVRQFSSNRGPCRFSKSWYWCNASRMQGHMDDEREGEAARGGINLL